MCNSRFYKCIYWPIWIIAMLVKTVSSCAELCPWAIYQYPQAFSDWVHYFTRPMKPNECIQSLRVLLFRDCRFANENKHTETHQTHNSKPSKNNSRSLDILKLKYQHVCLSVWRRYLSLGHLCILSPILYPIIGLPQDMSDEICHHISQLLCLQITYTDTVCTYCVLRSQNWNKIAN